jgi:arabinan endo-1,5-alpha-L-arabinosidase
MAQALRRRSFYLLMTAILLLGIGTPARAADGSDTGDSPDRGGTGTYKNPLDIQIPGDGKVESCADPTVIYGAQPGDHYWYMYCTTDPLNGEDQNPSGGFNFHLIPMMRSLDLVNWTYMGDAFATRPSWIPDSAGMWAPEIQYFNNQYYLYYAASDTNLPGGGSAIGVATAPGPLGPWTDSGTPVVEPHPAPCCPGSRRWVFDPEIVLVGTQRYIFYGSYFGGISARTLSADGLHSDPASQLQITIDNRYEGPEVVFHDGYYYLFASATDCCRGPLTGYSVFVGRSANVLGPYVDREGVSLLDARVGGTPALTMNGNRWVGTGHNTVFRDFDGQWWTIYHAVDRTDPYFDGAVGFTKRPALLDPLDWIDGWPTVRAGNWASDQRMQAPAAQPGQRTNYRPQPPKAQVPGRLIASASDEFNGSTLSPQWSWVRQPDASTYGLTGTTFRFDTQAADLFEGSNNASVLVENAPRGDYIVETKVNLNVPPEGCCFNYVQTGLVIYGDDDNFIKLSHVSIFNTRQTEFAKELFPVEEGYPRYGNTVVGPPSDWTYLRIVVERGHGSTDGAVDTNSGHHEDLYTAYTSQDGVHWVRGGVWTHTFDNGKIGLVSMVGSGFTANFDYVRVYELRH